MNTQGDKTRKIEKCSCECHKAETGSLWCSNCWKLPVHEIDRIRRGENIGCEHLHTPCHKSPPPSYLTDRVKAFREKFRLYFNEYMKRNELPHWQLRKGVPADERDLDGFMELIQQSIEVGRKKENERIMGILKVMVETCGVIDLGENVDIKKIYKSIEG